MANTAIRKATTGEALVGQDVIDARLAICRECPNFVAAKTSCKLCGCSCSAAKTLVNKLAHASSVCPDKPPRWGAYIPPGPGKLIGVPIDRSKLVSHILYHVMPLAGAGEPVWRRHMAWLREVRPQFNGRLIVGIVTPGKEDEWKYLPPDAVKETLADCDAEFITAPNDVRTIRIGKPMKFHRDRRAGKGEGVLFPRMLEMLQTSDPHHVAFYGHCKGVSRADDHPEGSSPFKWAEAMFETLFRNQTAAVETLDDHGICGPFLMRGGFPDGQPGLCSTPFFSGTFFAMRLVDVFARQWRKIPPGYGGVERWPNSLFNLHTEGKCLFMDHCTNLYSEEYWANEVTPAIEQWKAARCMNR